VQWQRLGSSHPGFDPWVLRRGEKVPSPRLLWGIRLVATVQSNQGVVDCGLARARACCPGCAAGFGGFLGRDAVSLIENHGGGFTPTGRVFFSEVSSKSKEKMNLHQLEQSTDKLFQNHFWLANFYLKLTIQLNAVEIAFYYFMSKKPQEQNSPSLTVKSYGNVNDNLRSNSWWTIETVNESVVSIYPVN
jgi:hypothetical protein